MMTTMMEIIRNTTTQEKQIYPKIPINLNQSRKFQNLLGNKHGRRDSSGRSKVCCFLIVVVLRRFDVSTELVTS